MHRPTKYGLLRPKVLEFSNFNNLARVFLYSVQCIVRLHLCSANAPFLSAHDVGGGFAPIPLIVQLTCQFYLALLHFWVQHLHTISSKQQFSAPKNPASTQLCPKSKNTPTIPRAAASMAPSQQEANGDQSREKNIREWLAQE